MSNTDDPRRRARLFEMLRHENISAAACVHTHVYARSQRRAAEVDELRRLALRSWDRPAAPTAQRIG